MKTASFVGVILPQTPVHLVQILNSIFQWGDFNPGTFTFNPNSMKISNWTTNLANQSHNDLDWPGFTRFVANTYQSRITRFGGKISNSNFCLCKKFDISQLCVYRYRLQSTVSGKSRHLQPPILVDEKLESQEESRSSLIASDTRTHSVKTDYHSSESTTSETSTTSTSMKSAPATESNLVVFYNRLEPPFFSQTELSCH